MFQTQKYEIFFSLAIIYSIYQQNNKKNRMFQTQKYKIFFSLAIIYSIFLSFCCYCTDKNMLFTNITMRRIACFLRESTTISARSLRLLAIIYGYFLSFSFSGRYNSPRKKYWEELYVSDAKIQTFRVARKSFKGFFLIFCCYWIDKNRVFTNNTVRRIACFRRESSFAINYGFSRVFFFFWSV